MGICGLCSGGGAATPMLVCGVILSTAKKNLNRLDGGCCLRARSWLERGRSFTLSELFDCRLLLFFRAQEVLLVGAAVGSQVRF